MLNYANITSFRDDNRVHRAYRYVATGEYKHLLCCAHRTAPVGFYYAWADWGYANTMMMIYITYAAK
jgi:hypothetical protein